MNTTCSICTDDLNTPKKCCIKKNNNKILSCNHEYHTLCIDMWLDKNTTCPLCRQVVKSVSIVDVNQNICQVEFIDRIKNNKNKIIFFILYILLLIGGAAHIMTSISTINYIHDIHNTTTTNSLKVKNINTQIIVIIVYLVIHFLYILLNKYIHNIFIHYPAGLMLSFMITLNIIYIFYIIMINNTISKYINENNTGLSKTNIINRNFTVMVYNATISSIYVIYIYIPRL